MLHSINLIFHEAGHMILMFFGNFIYVLGGTIGQLAIPALCGVHFLRRRNLFGTAIMLWWFGQNLIDISIYVSDARARVLPLLGGGDGHDWAYLLDRLNVLKYDILIGNIIYVFGIFIMTTALVGACVVVYKHKLRTKLR